MLEADMSRKKRRKNVDSLAAILILQSYLDYLKIINLKRCIMTDKDMEMLENEEYEVNLVTLIDEDGTERDFEVLEIIEVDGAEYVVMLPPMKGRGQRLISVLQFVFPPPTKEEWWV